MKSNRPTRIAMKTSVNAADCNETYTQMLFFHLATVLVELI